jgi:pyruvate kinase
MNVARFNFSHGTHAEHGAQMEKTRRMSAELGMPVAIMLDTKGPEIRTGLVGSTTGGGEGTGTVDFHAGDLIEVDASDAPTTPPSSSQPGHISLSWKEVAQKVKPGVKILIADGLFELSVLSTDGKTVQCKALNNATLGSRKNVNIVGVHAGLPIMSEQDKSDLAFGAEQNVDLISASFVSFPHEVEEIRDFLAAHGNHAHIIAKIESAEGVQNIEDIIKAADGVMVARGDLAQQIPMEQIPLVQKDIIALARKHGKPVITATQMLDSMIENPRPTRAELTDVANAIFDGSDAVMLSGETANGAYPTAAVETMATIARTVENSPEFKARAKAIAKDAFEEDGIEALIPTILSKATYDVATNIGAKGIVTPTLTGHTARLIAKYRPEQPVLAVTPNRTTFQTLLLSWGVIPLLAPEGANSYDMSLLAEGFAIDEGLAQKGDILVLTAGLPVGSAQPLNTIRALILGNIEEEG